MGLGAALWCFATVRSVGLDADHRLPHLQIRSRLHFYRHEIAYVFGQLSSPHSVPSLVEVLRRDHEEEMVRHEAAEALGGIATDDCLPVLQEFATKAGVPRVVKESCEVALDMVSVGLSRLWRILLASSSEESNTDPSGATSQFEYERSGDFQYAQPLVPA